MREVSLEASDAHKDVLGVFAGLRPLVKVGDARSLRRPPLSGPHDLDFQIRVLLHRRGRQMDDLPQDGGGRGGSGASNGGPGRAPRARRCICRFMAGPNRRLSAEPGVYGADAPAIEELVAAEPALADKIHPRRCHIKAEVVWAVREEMARNVETFFHGGLSRAFARGTRQHRSCAGCCRLDCRENSAGRGLEKESRRRVYEKRPRVTFCKTPNEGDPDMRPSVRLSP